MLQTRGPEALRTRFLLVGCLHASASVNSLAITVVLLAKLWGWKVHLQIVEIEEGIIRTQRCRDRVWREHRWLCRLKSEGDVRCMPRYLSTFGSKVGVAQSLSVLKAAGHVKMIPYSAAASQRASSPQAVSVAPGGRCAKVSGHTMCPSRGRIAIGESLRGNRIGATGLRASERKSASERVSEREGFQRFLRGFERFSEVLRGFQRF